jgi:hypothetical protein
MEINSEVKVRLCVVFCISSEETISTLALNPHTRTAVDTPHGSDAIALNLTWTLLAQY